MNALPRAIATQAAPPPPRAIRAWVNHARWLSPLALVALACLVYWNSLDGVFLFDDHNCISEQGIRKVGERRWVCAWTLEWNHRWGGLDPTGYHLVNIGIHSAAGLTLYALLCATLGGPRQHWNERRARRVAFAVASLWLCHPLQTESVTYVVQRLEALASLFYLLTLWGVARCAAASGRTAWLWGAMAALACCLGMATKEIVATAPLVALLYDRVYWARSWREVARRRWLLHGLLLAAGVVLAAQLQSTLFPAADAPQQSLGFGVQKVAWHEYLRTQPQVVLHYLKLTLWPRRLVLDYDWPIARSAGEYLPAMLAMLALFLATIWMCWKRPPLGWLGFSFFLILAPTSSFVPIADLAFEHRMYLPLAAVLTLLTLGAWKIGERWLPISARLPAGVAFLGVALLALSARTAMRNRDYHSSVAMWKSVIEAAPANVRAMNNLAVCLRAEGRDPEGKEYLRRGLQIQRQIALDDAFINLNWNLANVLLQSGEPAEFEEALEALRLNCRLAPNEVKHACRLALALATGDRLAESLRIVEQYEMTDAGNAELLHCRGIIEFKGGNSTLAAQTLRRAVEASPDNAEAHADLAIAWEASGQWEAALESHEAALRLSPSRADTRLRLATIYHRLDKFELAEAAYRALLSQDPNMGLANLNLGKLLNKLGRRDEALRHLQLALRDATALADAHFELARLAVAEGDWRLAETRWRAGLRVAPRRADIYNELGLAVLKQGRRAEAGQLFEQAVSLDPTQAAAHVNLGAMRLQTGQIDAAKASFQTALLHQPSLATAQKGLERCESAKRRSARHPETNLAPRAN